MAKKQGDDSKPLEGEIVFDRAAPDERETELSRESALLPVLSTEQMSRLRRKTPKHAIQRRQGPGGKMLDYVKHGYVTDQLNQTFGYDWDLIVDEIEAGKRYAIQTEEVVKDVRKPTEKSLVRYIAVAGHIEVRVHNDPQAPEKVVATIKKYGFGSQVWLPNIEFGDALKGARSDLLKTCATQLGIALDLYWDEEAESKKHENTLRKLEEKERADAQFIAERNAEALLAASAPPTNAIELLSKAANQYGINADELQGILFIEIPELINKAPEEIPALWEKVTLFVKAKEKK